MPFADIYRRQVMLLIRIMPLVAEGIRPQGRHSNKSVHP
jgi:hypothetical protein